MRVLYVEEQMLFSSSQLKLDSQAVERLARTLNAMNGVQAISVNQGRALRVHFVARTEIELERLKYNKAVPVIRHAIDRAKSYEEDAILAYLKS